MNSKNNYVMTNEVICGICTTWSMFIVFKYFGVKLGMQ